jgi:nucleoid DNA-binding protein
MGVQRVLFLDTKKEAEHVIDAVIGSLEATLLNNVDINEFTLKLGSFGKFSVKHRRGILRRIPFMLTPVKNGAILAGVGRGQ